MGNNGRQRKAIWRTCDYCGKRYKATLDQLKREGEMKGKFCSHSCVAKYSNKVRSKRLERMGRKEAEELSWEKDLAYLAGLITSDGSLQKDKPKVQFTNSDKELIDIVMEIIEKYTNKGRNKPTHCQKDESSWWVYQITSRKLYYFFQEVGIKPNKSKTIKEVNIPDSFFPDFLRGEIDGDGSFIYKPEQDIMSAKIYSGSKTFLTFLKEKINKIITSNQQGGIRDGNNVYELSFSLYDTQKIYNAIYCDTCQYYLTRKYSKVKKFFEKFKGREARVSHGPPSRRKLNFQKGMDIIKKYHENNLSMRDIASEYDVSYNTILSVLHLKHWTTRDLK